MIHQARSYLVGAISATTLVAVAVVAFVLLVTAQAVRDWPLGGLGLGGEEEIGTVAPVPPGLAAGGEAVPAVAGATGGAGGSPGPGGATPPAAPPPGGGTVTPPLGSGGSGGGRAPAPVSEGGGGGAGQTPGGGGGDGVPVPEVPPGDFPAPSETVTDTVGEVVSGVDEATGGALEESGTKEAAEGAVEEAAGPESTLGGTVDETAASAEGAVEGLLGDGD